ncbi:unnamed protein product [Penicillium camemberti]|uniref:Str. FM013 n=1 Tax=Penicillium camemberti (strain FM 013) TaxID=1429867 RepID=A0A0G4PLL8_PENC3|nr:unnamed protein product [Penicillium camemberti]
MRIGVMPHLPNRSPGGSNVLIPNTTNDAGQDAVVRAATAHEGKKKANAKAKEKSDQAEGQ